MAEVTIVFGRGASQIYAIRQAESSKSNWALAYERGVVSPNVEGGYEPDAGEWCVVLPFGTVDQSDLDGDSSVITYEHVPSDSTGLAAWRRS